MSENVENQERDYKPLLKQIVDFLNVADDESKKLWDILTALRGPDSDIDDIKYATTSVIRKTIGLTCEGGENDKIGAIILSDSYNKCETRQSDLKSWHFDSHVRSAFDTLGLKWEEVNYPNE